MSGKAYTMREMKGIVEHLTQHRAYGEIKGRKMWMDYANSELTTRTWQSLKETFLKRILPDITNPYYKLTVEQIASFKHGTDLEAKFNNKLEVQTVQDDSSDDTHKKNPQSSNPNNPNGGDDAGEVILCSKTNQIRSASTETVVIEPCYNTVEEIQKDLESPSKENEEENLPVPCSTKSIRDYITYSEPLTPMLQEVLHDFASEDETDEPQMQIVEYPEPCIRNEASSPIEILDTENNEAEIVNNDVPDNTNKDKNNDQNSAEDNIDENVLLESNLTDGIDKSNDVQSLNDSGKNTDNTTENTTHKTTDKNDVPEVNDIAINNISNDDERNIQLTKSQCNSNSMTDTLPNNQEAFLGLGQAREHSSEKHVPGNLSSNESTKDSRKRSKSEEIENMTPRKRICSTEMRQQTSSDGDTVEQHKESTSKLCSEKSKPLNVHDNTNHEEINVNNVTLEKDDNNDNDKSSKKNGETVCISDDSSSKKQREPQDVSIKTDEDEVSLLSDERESPRAYGQTTRSSIKKSTKGNKNSAYIKEVINEVVILKSHSESSSDHVMGSPKKTASLRAVHNVHRDRALANVFGFSSGAKPNRKKHKRNVKRLSTHQRCINTSSSEEWTSDTGSEYVSPPRGRKNKQSRKYLKPKAGRILSLERDGGLFVMYGKKIYPLVKDGKLIKNYVTYTPNHDSEDDESYWKLKYVEEKKKTDELTKLLKDNKKRESAPAEAPHVVVVRQEKEFENPVVAVSEPVKEITHTNVEQSVKELEKKEEAADAKTVKMKYMKNNETVQLEGHWSDIQPVVAQVMQILHKEPEHREEPIPEKTSVERDVGQVQHSTHEVPVKKQKVSRDSTPVSTIHLDEDVQEKIDKLEEEIYKKIQERDMADVAESSHEDAADSNVTKRKAGRPRQSQSANREDSASEPSKNKSSLRSVDEEGVDRGIVTRQQTRTPKKAEDKDTTSKIKNDAKRTTRNSSRNAALGDDDDSIKYKFPSPRQANDNNNKSSKKTPPKAAKRRYPIKTARIFSSPENLSINSIESSQGYQDSDGSNLSMCLRKKRKLSLTVLNRGRGKTQRANKRKIRTYMDEDVSSDSNISFVTAPLKSSSAQSSSLNTEVYRSESYQLLFPQRQNSVQRLQKIEERSPTTDSINSLKNGDAATASVEKGSFSTNENCSLSPVFVHYAENSSNVSLPPSPVLSIVEKLTLSKNVLDNSKNIDVPDDGTDKDVKQTMLNDYMLLNVDMSMPLMEQECDLQKSKTECQFKLNMPESSQQISDSLLNKVGAVNIAEPTLSESIHQKLKNLLIESAKKIAKQMNEAKDKDNVNKMEICEPEKQRKIKGKKRCSTPRKRQNKQNSKSGNVEPLIEEEHMESCEKAKSRPLPMLIVTDTAVEDDSVATDVSNGGKSSRLKKKRDVIKVKILKPKMKKKDNSSDDILQKQSKKSLQKDSGINDTESEVFFRGLDDSVDLIHNHSDTCLQGHECVDDSMEIIDDNAMSIISINSNSVPINALKQTSLAAPKKHKLLDICCENAQDAENLYTVTKISQPTSNENSFIFKSPSDNNVTLNSLLTDDLSDEVSQDKSVPNRVSKWYLLSEDEASNTNNLDVVGNTSNSITGCGANLQEIFPITCAVPDLSTITEENTAKFIVDGNTRSQFDSQSSPNI